MEAYVNQMILKMTTIKAIIIWKTWRVCKVKVIKQKIVIILVFSQLMEI